jgi:hypothetical protein
VKTPEQIADETYKRHAVSSDSAILANALREWMRLAIETDRAQRATYRIADLDGTDDEADWLTVGHILDEQEVEWLRTREMVAD